MTIPASVLAQLIAEVGDPNGTMTTVLASQWDIWAFKARVHPDLQTLYTKRDGLNVRCAEEQPDADFQLREDMRIWSSQEYDHVVGLRDHCQTEIVRIEAIARSGRVPKTGALTAITPEVPPLPDTANANDPRFRGDPYAGPRLVF